MQCLALRLWLFWPGPPTPYAHCMGGECMEWRGSDERRPKNPAYLHVA